MPASQVVHIPDAADAADAAQILHTHTLIVFLIYRLRGQFSEKISKGAPHKFCSRARFLRRRAIIA